MFYLSSLPSFMLILSCYRLEIILNLFELARNEKFNILSLRDFLLDTLFAYIQFEIPVMIFCSIIYLSVFKNERETNNIRFFFSFSIKYREY